MLETIGLIFQNPHLYRYFFQGDDITDDDMDRNRILLLSRIMLLKFDNYLQQDDFFDGFSQRKGWEELITDMFSTSPALRRVLSQNPGLFSDELRQFMEEGVRRALKEEGEKDFPDIVKVSSLLVYYPIEQSILSSVPLGQGGQNRIIIPRVAPSLLRSADLRRG